jgi:hypothetical protein
VKRNRKITLYQQEHPLPHYLKGKFQGEVPRRVPIAETCDEIWSGAEFSKFG